MSHGHGGGGGLKQVYIILGSTFLFGILTGAIIFFMVTVGKEGSGEIRAETKGTAIGVVAYGGCSRIGCPTYRIDTRGAYVYRDGSGVSEEDSFEDVLTSRQLDELHRVVASTDFEALDDTEFLGTCPVTYDGLAYQYTIEYEGERYEIDSCIEVTEGVPLFELLNRYFTIFSTLYGEA